MIKQMLVEHFSRHWAFYLVVSAAIVLLFVSPFLSIVLCIGWLLGRNFGNP